jgi:hypothetical protein
VRSRLLDGVGGDVATADDIYFGGVRIDEKRMTNLYIYKVVCNPSVDQPADL